MKLLIATTLALSALSLVGCVIDPSVEGRYVSDDGKAQLVFEAGMVYHTTAFGKKMAAPYKVEGGEVKFQFVGGLPMALQIDKDGSGIGIGWLGHFKKA